MAGGGPVVLIVDDHRVLSEAVATTLRGYGFDVTVARRYGEDDLVNELQNRAPAVVLLDVHLGETISTPLIRPLTEAGGIVIVLTADPDPRVLGRSLREGAVAALPKELAVDDIVLAIEHAWNGEPAMSRAKKESLLAAARQLEEEKRDRLAPFEALTPREKVILRHLLDGRSPKAIARHESVSLATVRSQLRTLFAKLGVRSQREAVASAHANDWS